MIFAWAVSQRRRLTKSTWGGDISWEEIDLELMEKFLDQWAPGASIG
jgi:hypothetical protein